MTVENIHASVGDCNVDVTRSFTDDAEEFVRWTDLERSYCEILAVHLNNGNRIVLPFPSKVVNPATEIVTGVANNDVEG